MIPISRSLFVLFLLFVITSGCTEKTYEINDINKSVFYKTEHGVVTSVIDGDTIIIDNETRVRLLGINTPERGRYLYGNATSFLKKLVLGKNVTLKTDFDSKDQYGRSLRYVFYKDVFINAMIVESGFATLYIIEPNDRYKEELSEAERIAKEKKRGLWDVSEYFGCINISEFVYDAQGSDNENPNGEYVRLKNNCDYDISLDGWTIKDESTKQKTFSNESRIISRGSITIYSGGGKDEDEKIYWYSDDKKGMPVWNNDGDALYLADKNGKIVLAYAY